MPILCLNKGMQKTLWKTNSWNRHSDSSEETFKQSNAFLHADESQQAFIAHILDTMAIS